MKNGYDVISTREPGGTEIGKKIRRILLEPSNKITSYAELFLLLADRAQHIEDIILKNLNEGKIVLSDRFFDSTIAYQGGGRMIKEDVLKKIMEFDIFSIKPDLTFLLDIPPEVSLKRLKKIDRIESQEIEFHRRVRERYRKIAESEPRFYMIDATDDVKNIHNKIKEKTMEILRRNNL